MQYKLSSEKATEVLATQVSQVLQAPVVVYLEGDLGAGKTTFVRALLHALGFRGRVKSPTYTLVEPYKINAKDYFHFDLYRLGSPLELEAMGIQDYMHENSICLIEWPEKGEGILPRADLIIKLALQEQGENEEARICHIEPFNPTLTKKIEAISL